MLAEDNQAATQPQPPTDDNAQNAPSSRGNEEPVIDEQIGANGANETPNDSKRESHITTPPAEEEGQMQQQTIQQPENVAPQQLDIDEEPLINQQIAPESSLPNEASQDTHGQKTMTDQQEGGSVSAKGTPNDKGTKMAGGQSSAEQVDSAPAGQNPNVMDQQNMQMENQMDQDEIDQIQDEAQHEQIIPTSQPPEVPQEGNYIDALKEAGVDKQRIEQFQQNVEGNEADADEFNIMRQYSNEEIENFRCIFEMFDKEYTGFVNVNDLQTIMKSLGRDPQEALDLLEEMDIDPSGLMSFEEFLKIMKNLENRLVASKQGELGAAPQEGAGMQGENPDMVPREGSLEERNKYGCLLPRTGVHFLPDSKVVDFLRLLNDYRKKCCKEMNLTEARRAALKFEDLRNKEMLRQLQNMKQAQEQELITVESAQRAQFLEFSSAWDNYMSDYEATAYLSLEKLKEKHLLEIQQLHDKIRKEQALKITFSKELMDMRKKVQKLMHTKRYEEAEELNMKCNFKEQEERDGQEEQIETIIEQQEGRLRRKQQMALAALLKRIQRDRNEQLKHRQIDSQRLIQRNKNLLLDLLNKQNMETRRTNQFLRFALGARSPDKKKYFKSKLFYDPNDARLPMSQQQPQREMYPAGSKSNSRRALANHPMSKEGQRPTRTVPTNPVDDTADLEQQEPEELQN